MEFYEQGVLLFESAKKFSNFLIGVDCDMYIASADAFMKAHYILQDTNEVMSNRSYRVAFHLYRHCVNNASKKSKLWFDAYEKFKTFV
jgi:hypothetical protein